MKKLWLLICSVLLIHTAFAQGFIVEKAQIDIHINAKGYFDVVEKYDINFKAPKHGIIRDIQTKYQIKDEDGKVEKRKVTLSKIKVPTHKFQITNSFLDFNDDYKYIRIGDKNKTVTGLQHYEIKYRVHNAFLFNDEFDQFYWNVKSSEWYAEFQEVNFNIIPPKGTDVSLANFFVYAGDFGDTGGKEYFDISYNNGVYTVTSKPGFTSHHGASVTALLKMPKDTISKPNPIWLMWKEYGWIGILLAVFIYFYSKFKTFSRKHKVTTTISYFPPENIDPSMAGFLIDDKADGRDLIALLPYWGRRGIIRLEEIPKKGILSKADTKLIRLKPLPPNAPHYEKTIYEGLFGVGDIKKSEVLISSLKDSFHSKMSSARTKLKAEAQKYYDKNVNKEKNALSVRMFIIFIILIVIFLFYWGPTAAIVLIPTIIIMIVAAQSVVRKNSDGRRLLSDLKGFSQFIKVAEEKKLEMLIKDYPDYFEDTLAYAVAFGMLASWTKKFAALNIPPPTWYYSPTGIGNMNTFANSFTRTMNTTQSTMMSVPSSSGGSSGGGFSGGGFGGGGGRSW